MTSTKPGGFGPVSQWPTLEELSADFEENLMLAFLTLAGETIVIIVGGPTLTFQ